ncbi:hypothetical protein O1611_g7494 [Lasiodiplodia mahajangana]|uniref:Uncharacterized protein n=1 Tax=Lasiodiplodia mahajangana TaxID=1108764 RepID=A0ACC2JFZ3_9PEZI|nr:hypothetical protein O1611_g7494 [Lasiodiplodia mahajangana]
MEDESLREDVTYRYLRQSAAFQDWMNKKNADRVELRYNLHYDELVSRLRKFRFLANHGPAPPVRADAKYFIPRLERVMEQERKKFSAAELQYIREIEKGWVSFVSLEKYEEVASRRRNMSERARLKSKRPLSKVECLLGSDGSTFDTPALTQACSTLAQPTPYMIPYGYMEGSRGPNGPRELLAPTNGVSPSLGNPYEILVPDWFPVAEAQGHIHVVGDTIEERFTSLLNYIYQLEFSKSQHEYKKKHPDEEGAVKDESWDKNWHEPNSGWPYEHHRREGGWWKCRKGLRATDAENNCRYCSDAEVEEPTSPTQLYDDVMQYIEEAMAVVAGNDREIISRRIAYKSRKPIKVEADSFQWHADEYWDEWEYQRGNSATTTVPRATPFSARQPFADYSAPISNHSPLGTRFSSQAYVQQTAPKNKGQQISHKNAGKGKEVSGSNSTDKNIRSWELLRLSS